MGRILPLVLVIIAGGCGQPTPPATAPASDFSDQRLPAVTLGNGQSYAPYADPDLVRRVDDQGNTIPNKHGQKVLGEDRRGGLFLVRDSQAGDIILDAQGRPAANGRYVDSLDVLEFKDGTLHGLHVTSKGNSFEQWKDGRKHGTTVINYDDGTCLLENYKNGELHGLRIQTHTSGDLTIDRYVKGQLDGASIEITSAGLITEQVYVAGQKYGDQKTELDKSRADRLIEIYAQRMVNQIAEAQTNK